MADPAGKQQVFSRPVHRAGRSSSRLSVAQERLWVLEQLTPGTATYNISVTFRTEGDLNVPAMCDALRDLVQRHDTLRVNYVLQADGPIQVWRDAASFGVAVHDFRTLEAFQKEAALASFLEKEARRPFDLSHDLPMRAALLRLDDRTYDLLLMVHHMSVDGWSFVVLLNDLMRLYQSRIEGTPSGLADLPITYADFGEWQRENLTDDALRPQITYWKERIGTDPEPLALCTDRPRPAQQSFDGATAPVSFSSDLTQKMKLLALSNHATPFMVLLAGFQTLLRRYTGQERICLGSPAAGRGLPELEGLVGLFVNTILLPMDFSGDPTFREVLGRAKQATLDALAHQEIPFEKLVEALQPARDLSRSTLFQAMLALRDTPPLVAEGAGLRLEGHPIHSGTAKFDLLLDLAEENGCLTGCMEYVTTLFDGSTIERLIANLKVLLEAAVDDPDLRVSALPLLSEGERRMVLEKFNRTARGYPHEKRLHDFFEEQAARTPSANALCFEGEWLSYAELNARANRLARYLRRHGVGPEVLVGVCMERSIEMVVALYAVVKAGGAYVPLDPEYPKERLKSMLEDAQPPVVLIQEGLRDVLPRSDTKVFALDTEWSSLDGESSDNLGVEARPQNGCYAIFTSGSTGKPKGVLNIHEGLVNRLLWMQEEYQLDAADRVLQKTPYSFDVSVWEFFWPLMTGASLVVARPGVHRDPAYLVDLIQQQQITTLHFVPSVLQVFLEADGVEDCRSLRRVICSGEALPYELREQFFARCPAELHNLYGPTEASIDVTHWECRRGSGSSVVPIGRPIANTQIYILDRAMAPVPIGAAGELHIGGVGLARGYLRRPDLTKEKFVPDPISGVSGARLYKTGDSARWLPDGSLEYLGRLDHQVKIRGFRIELGEIEAVLAMHPMVRQNVVVVQQTASGDKRLVAYVVPQADAPAAKDLWRELRDLLARSVPAYMIPAVFVSLDALPMTTSGKANRLALPAPAASELASDSHFVAPRNDVEEKLAAVWRELFGRQTIGVHDDFFELGGHSLLAVRLMTGILKVFGKKLPLATLLSAPTISQLAVALAATGLPSAHDTRRVPQPLGGDTSLALIALQAKGSRPPFYCVHGNHGKVLVFRQLGPHLGDDQPFFGLEARDLEDHEVADVRVEKLAASYVAAIRTHQSHGPYYLGGFCDGGVIALEMAQILSRQGEVVALLALFAPAMLKESSLWRHPGVLARHARLQARRFAQRGVGGNAAFVAKIIGNVKEALGDRLKKRRQQAGEEWIEGGTVLPRQLANIRLANQNALSRYCARPYPGRIVLFQPTEASGLWGSLCQAQWKEVAQGGLEVRTIPGIHVDIFREPRVARLAEELRAFLK